jgi:hypothetical protein
MIEGKIVGNMPSLSWRTWSDMDRARGPDGQRSSCLNGRAAGTDEGGRFFP